MLPLGLNAELRETEEANFTAREESVTDGSSGLKSLFEVSSFSSANTDVNFVSVGNADLNWLSRAGVARPGDSYASCEANAVGGLSSDVGTDDFAGSGVTGANVIGSLSFFDKEGRDSLKLGTFQSAER